MTLPHTGVKIPSTTESQSVHRNDKLLQFVACVLLLLEIFLRSTTYLAGRW
jgi:hypothetical protein